MNDDHERLPGDELVGDSRLPIYEVMALELLTVDQRRTDIRLAVDGFTGLVGNSGVVTRADIDHEVSVRQNMYLNFRSIESLIRLLLESPDELTQEGGLGGSISFLVGGENDFRLGLFKPLELLGYDEVTSEYDSDDESILCSVEDIVSDDHLSLEQKLLQLMSLLAFINLTELFGEASIKSRSVWGMDEDREVPEANESDSQEESNGLVATLSDLGRVSIQRLMASVRRRLTN